MSESFDRCRKQGGKIKIKELKGGKYMHVCILNGKSYPGEVKMKSNAKGTGSAVADAMEARGIK